MASGTLDDNESGEWVNLPFGRAAIALTGTFGSGTAAIEKRMESGSAIGVASGAFSTETTAHLDIGSQCDVRVTLAGATAPSLYWEIVPLLNA
jgi:hypothetical protein